MGREKWKKINKRQHGGGGGKTKELMYFNDCTRVSSTSAVKSHPTHSLPLFNRLMLCTVNHNYFKNKKYNENVGKGSIFLQSADIPQISTSPDMEVLYSVKLRQPEALRRQGLRGRFVFTRWSHIVQVIPTLTTVTWANCHLNQKRQRPRGPQPLARVWLLNEGAGPDLSSASSATELQGLWSRNRLLMDP